MPPVPIYSVPRTGTPFARPGFSIEQGWDAPVLPLTNSFEGGTATTAITVANSDSVSGAAFDAVTVTGAGNTITFDATHTYGSLAMMIDPTHATGLQSVEWNTQFGTQTGTHYGRAYVYTTTGNTPAITLVQYVSGTTQGSSIVLLNTGLPRIVDSAGATMITASTPLPNNQWVRLEWKIVQSTTAGACELLIFNTPDSATPDFTLTSAATFNTLTSVNRVLFGKVSSNGAQTAAFWLDNIGAAAPAYMGPAAGADQTVSPPAAAATANSPTPFPDTAPLPAAATASALSLVSVPQLTVSPAAAIASASSLISVPQLQVSPAVASASAGAPTPTIVATVVVSPPAATASASSPTPRIGQIYFVDPAGSDANDGLSSGAAWQTVTKLNSTTFGNGDTVLLKRGGTWTGTLWTVLGAGLITIADYGTGALPIIDGNHTVKCLRLAGAGGITRAIVKNIALNNAPDGGALAVNALTGTLLVSGCSFTGNAFTSNGGALLINNCSAGSTPDWQPNSLYGGRTVNRDPNGVAIGAAGRVTSCTFTNNSNDGIWCSDTPDLEIDNNTITGTSGSLSDGIQMDGTASAVTGRYCSNYWIHHNSIDMVGTTSNKGGITTNQQNTLGGYTGGLIELNTCNGGNWGISLSNNGAIAQFNTITNCVPGTTPTQGCLAIAAAQTSQDQIIRYNTVFNSARTIYLGPSGAGPTNVTVYNNTIYGTSMYRSIWCETGTTATFANNIVWGPSAANALFATFAGNTVTMDYDLIGPEATSYIHYLATNYSTLATFQAGTSQETHGKKDDPLLANATTGDLHLTYGSPGVGAGTIIGGGFWQTTLFGTAPDIGALEAVLTPAATASASAPAPGVQVQVPALAATASASAPVPTVTGAAFISPPAATASASAPTAVPQLRVAAAAASASASAPVPVITAAITVSPPAATASASSPTPAVQVAAAVPAATASVSAPLPAIQAQVPVPVASETASSPTPLVTAATLILPPVATASASSLIPAVKLAVAALAATASASSPLPQFGVSLILPAAGAGTGSARLPTLNLTVTAPSATAAAAMFTPFVFAGVPVIITTPFQDSPPSGAFQDTVTSGRFD